MTAVRMKYDPATGNLVSVSIRMEDDSDAELFMQLVERWWPVPEKQVEERDAKIPFHVQQAARRQRDRDELLAKQKLQDRDRKRSQLETDFRQSGHFDIPRPSLQDLAVKQSEDLELEMRQSDRYEEPDAVIEPTAGMKTYEQAQDELAAKLHQESATADRVRRLAEADEVLGAVE